MGGGEAEKEEPDYDEVAVDYPADLEAQLEEDLDTNFEDVEGDVPMEEEEDLEPEQIDVSGLVWLYIFRFCN